MVEGVQGRITFSIRPSVPASLRANSTSRPVSRGMRADVSRHAAGFRDSIRFQPFGTTFTAESRPDGLLDSRNSLSMPMQQLRLRCADTPPISGAHAASKQQECAACDEYSPSWSPSPQS
jgi:hypothetical protein